jgi:hypothetical protein
MEIWLTLCNLSLHSNEKIYYIQQLDILIPTICHALKGIREHWFIENTLHWTKDVTFKEDASKINKGQAPQNISLIKNWVMAIFRKNKFNSMAQAIRMVANDLGLMVNLLE